MKYSKKLNINYFGRRDSFKRNNSDWGFFLEVFNKKLGLVT